jgi:short-subunit dehydrogenase
MELRGKRVWLIGASSGMGAALVPLLLDEGARLAISARREETLQELANQHSRRDGDVLVRPLDVTDGAAVDALTAELWQTWDGIDVLIYSSGTWELADIAEFETPTAIRQIDVNYLGLVRVVGALLPRMIERRSGEIVGVASLSGFAGFPRAEAYSSSKAGSIALLQSLRIDLRKYGIGVTTVNPGFFESRLTSKNTFRMPFLMSADEAAAATVKGLRDGKAEINFPLPLTLLVKLMTGLPRPAYEFLARRFMAGGRSR